MSTDRFDELAAAWSIGDPDPAQRAKLEDLLRRDPVARQRFLDHCVAEMALVESLAMTPQTAGAVGRPEPLRLNEAPAARRHTIVPPVSWAAGIAAVLLIALLSTPLRAPATVTAGELLVGGRTIGPGSRVVLPLANATAGAAGATLDTSGIVVEAGAGTAFAISAPGSIRLQSGQLQVAVDGNRAPATTVYTDELTVAVAGTRFSVVRDAAHTEVDVQQGRVRVTTAGQQVQELSAGMQIAADSSGFVTAERQRTWLVRLTYLADDLSQRVIDRLDQPIRVPADRPFTLRADVDHAVAAVTFRLVSSQDLPKKTRRIESTRPFDLWGDTDQKPDLFSVPAGTHRMSITFYADQLGERRLATQRLVLIAE